MINNVVIGRYCSIGFGFKAGLGIHPTNFISTSPIFYSSSNWFETNLTFNQYFDEYKRTFIGNDVWIGANVLINDGICIGDGAIIGAGAVVTKDVPGYSIVGGVPAKVISYRHSEEVIDFIKKCDWWNKDLDWIKNNLDYFRVPIESLGQLRTLNFPKK